MILRLKYEDLTATGVRGEVNGKMVNFFMRIEVNELNIVQAIEKLKDNKWVVAFDYVGENGFLNTVDLTGVTVIVKQPIQTLDMNVDFIMNQIPDTVRVVLELPKTYSDMKVIYDYSQKYPNLHFEGGSFIHLEGCRLGAIVESDIPKKIAKNRLPLVTEGYASVMVDFHIDDLDIVEFYEVKSPTKRVSKGGKRKSSSAKPKKKKQLSSLLELSSTSSFENF